MILAGIALRVGAKSGRMKRQSHRIGNLKAKARLRLTLGGDPLAGVGMKKRGLPRGKIPGFRNLNPSVEIETTLGMEKGVGLRLGIHTLTKGSLERKNGCRKVDWEPLSGKEMTKSELRYGAKESQTHRI